MEMPTVEALDKEKEKYQAHLAKGGKPIRLVLELYPWDTKGGGMEWKFKGNIPDAVRDLKWTMEFTLYIKEVITKAIQPPKV